MTPTTRIAEHGLQVAPELHGFIQREVLPAVGLKPAVFWQGFARLVHDLAPRNAALLAELCGCMPLALRLCGCALAGQRVRVTPEALIQRLQFEAGRLQELRA